MKTLRSITIIGAAIHLIACDLYLLGVWLPISVEGLVMLTCFWVGIALISFAMSMIRSDVLPPSERIC